MAYVAVGKRENLGENRGLEASVLASPSLDPVMTAKCREEKVVRAVRQEESRLRTFAAVVESLGQVERVDSSPWG